ncbi:uncharacterized protein LOC113640954 isoform X2 [Tachysurus fulvidraco]|uniref:uncharacterized protein LOC113640954 isoform X2 n=1 Tax=Tachysurus fulvidraco TaxID=1234273 RepID=UPI000F501082|nr:uncharacterized protein LOC113640954 isoform X2 [Tachysurus fulvidraco]
MQHLVFIMFWLSCADCTKPFEHNTQNQMNRNVSKGENVILHCDGNRTSKSEDIGWRKDKILLFNYSPGINQTVINYTSDRMHVDPQNPRKLQISDVQPSDAGLYSCFPFDKEWILTIAAFANSDREIQQDNIWPFYIVFSVSTVCVTVCLFCGVCLHRKWKERAASDPTESSNELVYTVTSSDNFSIGFKS